jgi:hypothetical protein
MHGRPDSAGRLERGTMAKTPLLKKLRLQPEHRALILNAPQGYVESLTDLPQNIELSTTPDGGEYDFVHLFVLDSGELEEWLPAATEAARYDGLFWISYPKKSSKVKTDLSRDVLWELMMDTSLRPVTQISVDETWSAIRFRPAEEVGR